MTHNVSELVQQLEEQGPSFLSPGASAPDWVVTGGEEGHTGHITDFIAAR